MALIDRVKHDPSDDTELVCRWPEHGPAENLVLGTQVIVNQSQEVVFVKGGRALDILGPGTHTLSTANIPILQALVNLPFGGKTPFTAEVYYVNRKAKLDIKWGTASPLMLVDPQFQIAVPVRAFGQFGMAVGDSRTFVTEIVGTLGSFGTQEVERYFHGLLVSKASDLIAKHVVRARTPILELSAHLSELSEGVREEITAEFARFGVTILNFYIMSISVPEKDPAVAKLREVLGTRAELLQLGDGYRMKRSFDVLEQAASNSGGVAGTLMAGGLGIGLGMGAAPALGRALSGEMGIGAVGTGGSPAYSSACAGCQALLPVGARFCPGCGQPVARAGFCAACGSAVPADGRFCPACGVGRS